MIKFEFLLQFLLKSLNANYCKLSVIKLTTVTCHAFLNLSGNKVKKVLISDSEEFSR